MSKTGNAVLIIDDEPQIRRFVRAGFELQDFRVREAENAAEGIKQAMLNPPDLIILDLGLPDMSGADVLERIRSWSNVPIIVLSIESDEQEKVRLLKLGADDYVVKPFGIAELMARGDAALRRYFKSETKDPVVKAGALTVDLVSRVVTLNKKRVLLTRKEYNLLHVLASHFGLVVTHQQLLKEIWGSNQVHNIQYLRILVRKVRQKIEVDPNRPKIVVTESGVGYRLESASNGDDTTNEEPATDLLKSSQSRARSR
jgi:two-component system, OmpR family, KDP operon response regulator KdpE